MAIGERIRFLRNLRGMTQKFLGMAVGFPEKSAEVRLAQYEAGARTPKADLTAQLATVLNVSPRALTVPETDSYLGLMHTLFSLEDLYGIHAGKLEGDVCLRLDKTRGSDYANLFDMLNAWQAQVEKLESGEITREEYDRWRYSYPETEHQPGTAKVVSQQLSDLLTDGLSDSK